VLITCVYTCNICRGPPRFGEDRPRFGDRDGYRGGPRGAPGDFGGEKGGAPAEFQPSFRVTICPPMSQGFV
jgi:small subunit ribosomal protein S10e